MATPVCAIAPGRVELLGNHTDYNRGLVLGAAIDRRVQFHATPRDHNVATFRSAEFEEAAAADLRKIAPLANGSWANYALGVLRELQQLGFELRGFDARIASDLPLGSGLSSSAAFEVATAYAMVKLNSLAFEPLEIARLCRRAENRFVGVQSGLLDQATSVFGEAEHAVFIDCDTEEIRTIPFPGGCALVIADTRTAHRLSGGEFNARRDETAAAARALHAGSLREVSVEQLEHARTSLAPTLHRRALHVVSENDRVLQAVAAMRVNDVRKIGQLMNASHESSRSNFENSTAELDALAGFARELPHVFGSRLTGGGFGGGTVTLAEAAHASEIARELNAFWERRTGQSANAFVCRISNGAAILNSDRRRE